MVMRFPLHFKLGIFVVLLFAAVIAACLLWTPVRYLWLKSQLSSDNTDVRNAAINKLLSHGERATPYFHSWLRSGNDKLVSGVCEIIGNNKRIGWKQFRQELEDVLGGSPSLSTEAAAHILNRYDQSWELTDCEEWWLTNEIRWSKYGNSVHRKRNIMVNLINERKNEDTTKAALHELLRLNDHHSIKFICTQLESHPDRNFRELIAEALEYSPRPKTLNTLLRVLANDASYGVKSNVMSALNSLKDRRAVKPLLNILKSDPDRNMRSRAAWSLNDFEDYEALDILLEVLKSDTSADVRDSVAYVLSEFDEPEVTDALVAAVAGDCNSEVRRCAALALCFVSRQSALPVLRKAATEDEDENVRSHALSALNDLEFPDKVEFNMKVLSNDPDDDVCRSALTEFNETLPEKAYDLICRMLLDDRRTYVRSRLKNSSAIGPLTEILTNSSVTPRTRSLGAYALGHIGNESSIQVLKSIIETDNATEVLKYSVSALGYMNTSSAIRIVTEVLYNSSNAEMRSAAVFPVNWLLGEKAFPHLAFAVKNDCSSNVRLNAVIAVGNYSEAKAVPLLTHVLLHDENSAVVSRCALELLKFISPEIEESLKQAYESGNPGAATVLAWLHGGKYVSAMRKRVKLREISPTHILNIWPSFMHAAESRWGNVSTLRKIIDASEPGYIPVGDYYADVLSRLPDDAPKLDLNAEKEIRERQERKLMRWYRRNKYDLEWNLASRKYYVISKSAGK
jgi:HEAT repeat protein